MMHEMFDKLFGKGGPFKGGAPVINIFITNAPIKKIKVDNQEKTIKKLLQSSKNIEAGQATNMHAGGG